LPTAPELAKVVNVPAEWRRLDFLSDVHLHPSEPATAQAWQGYMATTACDALFILGDLFEVWVGDDVVDDPAHGPFWRHCAGVIRQTSQRLPVFFMVGNRDFLVGNTLLATAGMVGLDDPAVLDWGNARWLLSHGDVLCTGDLPYQAFRRQVRSEPWQTDFLRQPLHARMATAAGLRAASESRKAAATQWIDVDPGAAQQALHTHSCTTLIHGHTHQPAHHTWPDGTDRWVLSDWSAEAFTPRLQVLTARRDNATASPVLAAKNL
jgi:UDP-2,3-diacylglucosamine hydrolase